MVIKSLHDIPFFEAADKTILKEVFHPKNDHLAINYSLAFAKLATGESSTPHRLKSSELYIITEGKGKMYINAEESLVQKGNCIFVPPLANQHLENLGASDLEFYCIVSPPWAADEEWISENEL